MRKGTIILVVCIIAMFGAFEAGRTVGIRVGERKVEVNYQYLDGVNDILAFKSYRQMSLDLKDGRSSNVRCQVDLYASRYWDRLQKCISTKECPELLENKIKLDVPELIAGEKGGFRYFRTGDVCKP